MTAKTKYPRIPHLPFSPGSSDDDIIIATTEHFRNREVIVTEKMDGENTTFYCDYLHARSTMYHFHPSRTRIKKLHSEIAHEIPQNLRICGENMYAKHSIFYDNLESYFLVFGIFEGNTCLSWNDTIEYCNMLNLKYVPTIYQGIWNEEKIKKCFTGKSKHGGEQEGYVVRNTHEFHTDEFKQNIAKFVRRNHVKTDNNWIHKKVMTNKLKN